MLKTLKTTPEHMKEAYVRKVIKRHTPSPAYSVDQAEAKIEIEDMSEVDTPITRNIKKIAGFINSQSNIK